MRYLHSMKENSDECEILFFNLNNAGFFTVYWLRARELVVSA